MAKDEPQDEPMTPAEQRRQAQSQRDQNTLDDVERRRKEASQKKNRNKGKGKG